MKQDVGGRVAPQEVAQAAKFRGVLFVEEDRLQVQTVEQHQPAQAVGPFDRLGISPEFRRDPRDQIATWPAALARRSCQSLCASERLASSARIARSPAEGACRAGARSPRRSGLNASLTSTPRAAMSTAKATIRFMDDLVPVRIASGLRFRSYSHISRQRTSESESTRISSSCPSRLVGIAATIILTALATEYVNPEDAPSIWSDKRHFPPRVNVNKV